MKVFKYLILYLCIGVSLGGRGWKYGEIHTLGNFIGRNTLGSGPKMLARRLEALGGSIYMYYGVSYHMFAFLF